MDSTQKICPECAKEISKGAKKCPFCQSDLRSWFARHPIWTVFLFLFILGSVMQELGKNVQSQYSQNPATSGSVPDAVKPVVPSRLAEESKNIKIEGFVKDVYGYPHARLRITNNTKHTIDLFSFSSNLFNNADELQYEQISRDTEFGGQSQDILLPGKTVDWEWQLSLYPHATKIGNIRVTKLHYKDTGETIE